MLFETGGTNSLRLQTLRKHYKQRKVTGQVSKLLVDDKLFKTDPELAYSIAWGMANYLSVKNPKGFLAFLKQDSQRKDFHINPPPHRLKLFANHFGNDIDQFEANMRLHYR